MTEYGHAHPLPGGRRFEHVHNIRPALREAHTAKPLVEAHPDMAAVAAAPMPGSPADLQRDAALWREKAAELRARAAAADREAERLEALATADEEHPPSTEERIRRLFE